MNQDFLKELIEFVKTTDLQEVSLERDGSAVTVRRRSPGVPPRPSKAAMAAAAAVSTAAVSAAPAEKLVIRSTMVGTFYRSDSPDRPPLVVEGTTVASGQPVAAIEAMKIMKDVLSPSGCRIVKALVANGHAVEYGQPLFEVERVEDEGV